MAFNNTKSRNEVWLIGQSQPKLPENVQPTTQQVLQAFYHHNTANTVSYSLKVTIDSSYFRHTRARIPTALHQNITCKMRSQVEEYKEHNLLKENKSRHTDTHRCREEEFKTKLKLTFDISYKDPENIDKIEEDKLFLEDQRGIRKMVMAGVTPETWRVRAKEEKRKGEKPKKASQLCKSVINLIIVSAALPVMLTKNMIRRKKECEIPSHGS